jgi:hypothetical protein
MNRGCVSIGEIKCDSCHSLIEQGERYLLMEEEEEGEGKGKGKREDKKSRFCVECCLAKGYAAYVKEKSEEVLTFFPTSLNSES